MFFEVPVTLANYLMWTLVRIGLIGLFHLYSSNDGTVRPIPTAVPKLRPNCGPLKAKHTIYSVEELDFRLTRELCEQFDESNLSKFYTTALVGVGRS